MFSIAHRSDGPCRPAPISMEAYVERRLMSNRRLLEGKVLNGVPVVHTEQHIYKVEASPSRLRGSSRSIISPSEVKRRKILSQLCLV